MRLLLDESVPAPLRHNFPDRFEMRTVQQMGWAGIGNGRLLRLAADHGFQALVTTDRNMEHQQNRETLPVPVIVLTARRLNVQYLQPLVPRIVKLVEAGGLSGFYRIAGDPGAHVVERA